MKWIGISIAVVLMIACFFPWVTMERESLSVTGFDTGTTRFGKPGLVHVVVSLIYILLLLVNKTWSRRVAFFICAINIAWAIRNFLVIAACYAGECPVKHAALYILLLASVGTMIAALFTEKNKEQIST